MLPRKVANAEPLGPVAAAADFVERRMGELWTQRGSAPETVVRLLKPHAVVAVLVLPPVTLLAFVTPAPLLLPILSPISLAVAGLAALLAWARGARWNVDRITIWDIAGAFALIGCAAAMLSEPEYVLQLLGDPSLP